MKCGIIKTAVCSAMVVLTLMHTDPAVSKENLGGTPLKKGPSALATGCSPSTAQIDLQVNNVRAKMLVGGDMWWDLANAKYEVPVGSNKHSMFAGALWIGGLDAQGNLRIAAQTYRQTGVDYWPGAMDTTATDLTAARCNFYNRFWSVSRTEVANFIANGITTADILSWPGNGNATYNEGHFLAPFSDVNGDGIYDPAAGDYPGFNMSSLYPNIPGTTTPACSGYLYGDKSIWWVFNDVGNIHTETGSDPVGLEIRCQAFAYQSTKPSVNNATFYNYEVINRSSFSLNDMYFGQWADPDLGKYDDDYIGCDVGRGLGYCYNGDGNDDGASGYGIDPPAVGIDFLAGPIADAGDGIDNDRDGCVDCTFLDSAGVITTIPESVYGEQIIMSKFVYYNNLNQLATGNPVVAADFYNYLRGYWLDNQQISYGGDGRIGTPGNTGVPCDFMYPASTDMNFQPPTYQPWTEALSGNVPNDRRFLMSAGKFTMQPGEVNHVTTAVLWARQPGGGQTGSVNLLQQYSDSVQTFFKSCFAASVGVTDQPVFDELQVYPNPASTFVQFELPDLMEPVSLFIFDSRGNLVHRTACTIRKSYRLDTGAWSSGVYFYKLSSKSGISRSGKLLIQ